MNTKKRPLIIFGDGKISEAVSYYFERDSGYTIHAYIVDDAYAKNEFFLNKPVFKFSDVQKKFNPEKYTVFIAVGYQCMNSLRTDRYRFFKNMGYTIASYKSPHVYGDYTMGENTIVMDGAIIQPNTSFGNNVFVWGGAMVGHHAAINDDCWLAGGCLIGGSVKLGRGTFIGMGAIVGQEVKTGIECMLGAGTMTIRSIGDKVVMVEQQTDVHRLNSEQFTRMSVCFRM